MFVVGIARSVLDGELDSPPISTMNTTEAPPKGGASELSRFFAALLQSPDKSGSRTHTQILGASDVCARP
jgi:hypothetical protein